MPASPGKAARLNILQLQEAATNRSMLPCQSKLSDRPRGEGRQKGASVIDVGTARYAGPDLARCDLCGELQLSGGSWWHHCLALVGLALPGLRQAFIISES